MTWVLVVSRRAAGELYLPVTVMARLDRAITPSIALLLMARSSRAMTKADADWCDIQI